MGFLAPTNARANPNLLDFAPTSACRLKHVRSRRNLALSPNQISDFQTNSGRVRSRSNGRSRWPRSQSVVGPDRKAASSHSRHCPWARQPSALSRISSTHGNALLQLFRPVEDKINLRRSLRVVLDLRRRYNHDETSVWSDVKVSRATGVIHNPGYWKLRRFSRSETGFSPDIN